MAKLALIPPRWSDEDEVFSLVESAIVGPDEFDLYGLPDDYPGDRRFARALQIMELRTELAQLDRNAKGLGVDLKDMLLESRNSRAELAKRMKKDRTKKGSGKTGRPKMSESERRDKNPIHDAADLVPNIANLLQRYYPDRRQIDVKDRAYRFAEKFMGIDDENSAGSKVRNYLNSAKTDRRRLRSR